MQITRSENDYLQALRNLGSPRMLRARLNYLPRLAAWSAALLALNLLVDLAVVELLPQFVYWNTEGTLTWQLQGLALTPLVALGPAIALCRRLAVIATGLLIGGSLANISSLSIWGGAPDYFPYGNIVFNLPDVSLALGCLTMITLMLAGAAKLCAETVCEFLRLRKPRRA